MKIKALQLMVVAGFSFSVLLYGQTTPAAKAPAPAAQAGAPAHNPQLQLSTPGAPPAPAPPVTFPPADSKNFTAATPTKETVNAFLKQIWGYDPNRAWQVEAIQKTEAAGVSNVQVLVAEQGVSRQPAQTTFFVLPDGQHAIAGNQIVPFNADPYGAFREKLKAGANGPYRGATSKSLLLVEFADLQCPHCKEGQATMDRLVQDFPNAQVVFENFPLTQIHSSAEKAAEYGDCVAQLKGNAAFFTYINAVFDTQAKLTPDATDQTLQDAATKAGADAAAMKQCMATPAAKAAVAASLQLGYDVGVNQTPMLFINGRPVPLNSVPYGTLKQLVSFAAGETAAASKP